MVGSGRSRKACRLTVPSNRCACASRIASGAASGWGGHGSAHMARSHGRPHSHSIVPGGLLVKS